MGCLGYESKPRCLAVDLGASSGRMIVGEISQDRLNLREVSRFPTPLIQSGKYLCWNVDELESQIRNGIAFSAAAHPVTSLGIDSWAVDYVLLDGRTNRVGKAVSYRDSRTIGMMEQVQARISAKDIYRRTGIQHMRFNTLYQLAAATEQEPEWIEAAHHLLMIPDYFHFRLSGVLSNEYTNATSTQMLGVNGFWEQKLLAAAGLHRNLMLSPLEPGSLLGSVPAGKGLAKVIAPATHDTASAVAGTPLESEDEAFISSGTWSLMGIESRIPFASSSAMQLNFTNEGGVERRFRVLKNIPGMWLLQRVCEEHLAKDVETLIGAAEESAAWRSVVNPGDALFDNPPSMTEEIQTFCRRTHQPVPRSIADLARCIFDSLALSYRNVKEELEMLRPCRLKGIRIVGGGCRNRLLNQLCADACDLPVNAGPVEASSLGNISVQMIALGELENLDAARKLIRKSFEPRVFLPRAMVPEPTWNIFQQFLTSRIQVD